jgi:hypothetical protein
MVGLVADVSPVPVMGKRHSELDEMKEGPGRILGLDIGNVAGIGPAKRSTAMRRAESGSSPASESL